MTFHVNQQKRFLLILSGPQAVAFRKAATEQAESLGEWLRQASRERIQGNYDGLSMACLEHSALNQKLHMLLDVSLRDEIRLMAYELHESMSHFIRKAGLLRLAAAKVEVEDEA